MKTDSVGREIRPGDGVMWNRNKWTVSGDGGFLIELCRVQQSTEHIPSSDLTIVTRSGEPIDQISPLVKCAKTGGVIERGRRVDYYGTQGTVLSVHASSDKYAVTFLSDKGRTHEEYTTSVTLLPPEPKAPETEEITIRLVVKRGSDLTPALKAMVDVVEVRG